MNNASLSSDAAAAPTFLRRLGVRLTVRDLGTLIGLVVICAVFGLLSDVFFTERNLINILQQSSINSCVAIGMTMVIISGGVDLSVGPVAACSAVLAATVLVGGYSVFIAIPAGLLVGLLCGTFNGMLIAYGGLQPFIVTLGTLSLFRALALIYTGGNPILEPDSKVRQEFESLTILRVINRMEAIFVHAVELSIDLSQAFARRRQRPSQAKVRSTTHLRGSTTKPLATSERLTISMVHSPWPTSACASLGPA